MSSYRPDSLLTEVRCSFLISDSERSARGVADDLVHGRCVCLECMFLYFGNLDSETAASESDGDGISRLDLIGGFYKTAVDRDVFIVARFICDRPALYES